MSGLESTALRSQNDIYDGPTFARNLLSVDAIGASLSVGNMPSVLDTAARNQPPAAVNTPRCTLRFAGQFRQSTTLQICVPGAFESIVYSS